MTFETITLIIFAVIFLFREVMHHIQISKLQELLKADNIGDYYGAKKINNDIIKEDNEIIKNEEEFDIRKASKVIINGEETPINIIE